MVARSRQSGKRFWLLQTVGWFTFTLESALAALPFPDVLPTLVYFVGVAVTGFLVSIPLHRLCRRLWGKQYPWPRLMLITVLACYPLGFLCSLCGSILENAVKSHQNPWYSVHWRMILIFGFTQAFSSCIVLIAWSGIYFGVKQWEQGHRREEQLLEAESLAREAELRALRYQLTPHFLFNTLNSISTLVGEGDSQNARRMISLLGDFLRTTIQTSSNGDVPLGHELLHMQQYLAIEQIRLGDRLKTRFHIAPGAENISIPNLLLQPLIENAIRHGIAPSIRGGTLDVLAEPNGQSFKISIINSMEPADSGRQQNGDFRFGLGLTNTKERLASRYGTASSLEICRDDPRQWRVTLEIPHDSDRSLKR